MLPRTGLWGHADFMRLWSAQAFSAYGSRITRTALPFIAVKVLEQPEIMVGVLTVVQLAPGLIVGLTAGGYIDRNRKRPILIASDVMRAGVVGSLTIAWLAGILSMAHVLLVGALVGVGTALFQITDNAYLPTLVARDQLAEGNAKLESTEAVAEISGPATAGLLIAALGAPLAMVIDATSYVWSAARLASIRTIEPAINPAVSASLSATRRGHDLRVGFRAVFGNPYIRAITLSHMVWSVSGGFFMSLYTPWCLRELDLSATVFGVVVAMGGVGSFFGALLSRWMVASLGLGRMLVITSMLSLSCALMIPLAGSSLASSFAITVGLLAAHQLLSDGFSVAFVIQAVTLRQTVLPKHVHGRANAAIHVLASTLLPTGALAGAAIAQLSSTKVAVWIGVLFGLIAPIFLLPLVRLRAMPPAADIVAESAASTTESAS